MGLPPPTPWPALPFSIVREGSFERSGFELLPQVVSGERASHLRVEAGGLEVGSGLRGVLGKLPAARSVAEDVLLPLAREILGRGARPVRSILFDKTPASNWLVPWHQDLTVAVRERREVEGWGPWSNKEGVDHVQPPASVLEGMVTLRLHLDDTPADNGALRVVPGSHARGIIPTAQVQAVREELGEATCQADVGDVLMMRPLILHASSKSARPGHRRVLHVEFAAGELKDGLAWAESM